MRTSTPVGRTAHDGHWPRVVRELADDLALDAPARDRAGKPPYDEVARLKEAGLPALLVPPGADREGADLPAACTALTELAAADSSVAELLARHYALAWTARLLGTPEDAERFEAATAREGRLLAGAVGRPGGTGLPGTSGLPGDPDGAEPALVLAPSGRGRVLSGRLTLDAGATVADRLVVDARSTESGDAVVVLVDPAHPGVTASPSADRLGQRLTGAGSVVFDAVPVSARSVIGTVPRDEHAVAPRAALAPLVLRLLLSQVALGTAEGALAEARDISLADRAAARSRHGGRAFGELPDADPYLLLAYGESATEAHAAAAVAEEAVRALARGLDAGAGLDAEEGADIAALVGTAEAVVARAAVGITTRVLGLFHSSDPADGDPGLDRFWRNARVLTAHHSPARSLRDIGDHYLNSSPPRALARH
ncbi:acyl-CoA dehydrogenase family protein [Streptomyces sp. NPDC005805]|uniref:acyl-CoA dehydrogenase family protein n=1 Tax=Streptomyces sp. NPDC005805 TaxID=3157068 RepID=UPI0033E94523